MTQTLEDIETKDSVQAAWTNQNHGFSVIIGEQHEKNLHRIAERMAGMGGIRLKTVGYLYFRSEGELVNYCLSHKIRLMQLQESKPKITEQEKLQESKPKITEQEKRERCNKYGLDEKQLQFCEEYLRSHNATKSYMTVWPDVTSYKNASVKACYLLKKVGVRRYLDDRTRDNRL